MGSPPKYSRTRRVDGGGGLAVQLLVEDGLEQGFEGRRSGVEAQRKGAGAVDEGGEFGVGGLEMGDGFVGIEGKFAAAAVVDHGRSLSYRRKKELRRGLVWRVLLQGVWPG